jgi:predicted glycoside hydrolase/deacetylase ChbG (UPF0249 family)
VTRVLVVNADDFGRSHPINLGVALAHDHGIVTSASAMVCWSAAEDAAELTRERPTLGVGLHFDLGEWEPGETGWQCVYERAPRTEDAVTEELEEQLARFAELFERPPTHLDSHQHVHRKEPVRSVLLRAGRKLGVPVRELTDGIVYRGDFHGRTQQDAPLPGAISVDSLLGLFASLPAGVTELGCHPGVEAEVASRYAAERPLELETLCDARVRAAVEVEGITLRSFAFEQP